MIEEPKRAQSNTKSLQPAVLDAALRTGYLADVLSERVKHLEDRLSTVCSTPTATTKATEQAEVKHSPGSSDLAASINASNAVLFSALVALTEIEERLEI